MDDNERIDTDMGSCKWWEFDTPDAELPTKPKPKLKYVRSLKISRGCAGCGACDSLDLECHHRDQSTMKFRIAEAEGNTWEALHAEIAKCDVLCTACHIKRHRKRQL